MLLAKNFLFSENKSLIAIKLGAKVEWRMALTCAFNGSIAMKMSFGNETPTLNGIDV